MSNLNIVFAGTPAFGVPSLQALYDNKYKISAIFTQPDRPAGRGRNLQSSPVKNWGLEHNIDVFQPVSLRDANSIKILEDLKPHLMIVIAYGLILPQSILEIPKYGCINVHASLLPFWRGASPIQHTILSGDTKTGITIMQMDVGMDTGDILEQASCEVHNYTSAKLHDILSKLAVEPLLNTLAKIQNNTLHPIAQDNSKASYAGKIKKEDALIDWKKDAINIDRLIRAYNPWPIAYTSYLNDTMRIYKSSVFTACHNYTPGTLVEVNKDFLLVAAGKDFIRIEELQMPGGKIITPMIWSQNRTIPHHFILGA